MLKIAFLRVWPVFQSLPTPYWHLTNRQWSFHIFTYPSNTDNGVSTCVLTLHRYNGDSTSFTAYTQTVEFQHVYLPITHRQRSFHRVGPVLVTLDLPILHIQRQHGNYRDILFPDHLPEVMWGIRKGALCCNVVGLHLPDIHQDVTGINVVVFSCQFYSVEVICKMCFENLIKLWALESKIYVQVIPKEFYFLTLSFNHNNHLHGRIFLNLFKGLFSGSLAIAHSSVDFTCLSSCFIRKIVIYIIKIRNKHTHTKEKKMKIK